MKKHSALKTVWTLVRVLLTLAFWSVGAYLLYTYEYLSQFDQVDNIVGAMPVAFVILIAGGASVLLWMKPQKAYAALSVSLALVVVGCSCLFPRALIGDWWIVPDKSNYPETYPDITVYAPFKEDSKVARLDEESTLVLREDLPILDGALALYPVYSAFAQAAYAEEAVIANPTSVTFTDTVQAFRGLIAGERDIIITAAASKKQLEAAASAGVELHLTEIGKEAFVFLVGKTNPIDNISYQQIRNVYSGKTLKWHTLGWAEGGDILAFQRPEGSGSQTGLQQIMGDLPIQAPQPLPDESLIGTNSLMNQISVTWQGVQPALGYSYRYFANTMYANKDAKILKVNGVEPSIENIKNGNYPFTVSFYAITRGEPTGNTKTLIDWMLSPQGQALIEKTGYTPIK